MNKTISAIIVLAVVIAGGWYALSRTANTGGNDEIVATVNGTSITRYQLTASEIQIASQQGVTATSTEALAPFQAGALDLLIGQTLLLQAAKQAGITASSTATEMQLTSTKAQFNDESTYQQALAARSMTEDDLRSKISDGLVIQAYLDQQINLSTLAATDAEIKSLYDQLTSQQPSTSTPPPLNQVRDQVAQLVAQQKQQEATNTLVAQLRAAAQVQILVASSTPSA